METQVQAAEPVAAAPVLAPGVKLREYETNVLLRPDVGLDGAEKFRQKLRALVAQNGGKVVKMTTWNKKKLMYTIKDFRFGVYIHMHYLGPAPLVAEIERNLRISDEVLRYLSVRVADRADAERAVEPDAIHAGDAEQERPPREDRPERRDDDVVGVEGEGEGEAADGEPETA